MWRALAALAMIASATGPAAAQNSAPQMSEEARADLECAMWASFVAGSPEVGAETATAMGYALSYWIGKFEGATGLHFDDVATVDFVTSLEDRIDVLSDNCAPAMENMGMRLQEWGQEMLEAGEAGQP